MSEFTDKQVEELLKNRPEDLRKVKDNRRFVNYIRNHKVKQGSDEIKVFGVKSVNINAVLKDNIHDHTVFVMDKICRMHRNMLYEQLKKYVRKKRTTPINIYWIIIMIMGIAVALLIIVFLLPRLGTVI